MAPKKIIRIGSRGSLLALAQSKNILKILQKKFKQYRFKLVIIKTTGDEFQSVELFKTANIGVFTKELEKKLLARQIDIAVHSLKDLPTNLAPGLVLGGYPKREDSRDVLVTKKNYTLKTIPEGGVVGTGSLRRQRQIKLVRPDLNVVAIRGNLNTRILNVIRENQYHGVVVARAGLVRVKKYLKYAWPIPPKIMMTAVAQAVLGVQVRAEDEVSLKMAQSLNHKPTELAARIERHFLNALEGGCRVPVGVETKISGKNISLKAAVFSVKTKAVIRGEIKGSAEKLEVLAETLAKQMLKKGADGFLKEAREGVATQEHRFGREVWGKPMGREVW